MGKVTRTGGGAGVGMGFGMGMAQLSSNQQASLKNAAHNSVVAERSALLFGKEGKTQHL